MPNHISNVLTAPKHIIHFIKNEEGEVDFNKVIPMPESLLIEVPSMYKWLTENWSTKWNAYNVGRETETQIYFQTAWSPPLKVIEKLSKLFPNEDIILETADEDEGSQCYKIIFKNGEKDQFEYSGIDAIKHYFRIYHNNSSPNKEFLESCGYNENFEYIEEE